MHEGHRERLKNRFFANGLDGFAPHEVLELLLTFAIPQKDVNPIAHQLIETFGSVSDVLNAAPEELRRVPGVGMNASSLLSLMPKLFGYYQREYVYDVLYGGGSESLRNCLSFDTEVEAVYIYGDFAVVSLPLVPDVKNSLCCEGGFRLVPQKSSIDLRDITSDGYPFFAGTIAAKTTVSYKPGGATLLELPGRYAVC